LALHGCRLILFRWCLGVTWVVLVTYKCAGMPGEHTSPWYLQDSNPGLYCFRWRSQPALDIVVRSAPPPWGRYHYYCYTQSLVHTLR
jgi:hypothetical protein